MKILHLTHNDIKTDARTLKQIMSAEGAGHEVYGLGVRLDKGLEASKIPISAKIESLNLWCRKIWMPKIVRHVLMMMELSIRFAVKAPKFKPDLIHCSDTLVLPVGALLKKICNAKLVYDAHELESAKNGSNIVTGPATLAIEKALWKSVDSLIVVSPSIRRWYHENIGTKPTFLVLNSPLARQGECNSAYLRDHFSIPEDHKIFLYVGFMIDGRGILETLEVFANLASGGSVVFMGYGPLKATIIKYAAKHPNIFFHEGVEHEQVVPITRSADVGLCLLQNVSLSDFYSLPNKFLEYIFAGIPVIVAKFPDLSEYTYRFKVGVAVDFSVKSLGDAVHGFCNGEHGFTVDPNDLDELSWEQQAKCLLQSYASALEDTQSIEAKQYQ